MIDHPLLGGKLTMMDELAYYDQPVLFTALNPASVIYLVMLNDTNGGGDKWIVAPLDGKDYDDLYHNRLDLHDAFLVSPHYFLVTTPAVGAITVEQRPTAELTDDRLPARGEFAEIL